ncbi:Ig-like domain-containing protein [Brevibacillus nitrificans]|uniref:Ig-like domain-containing protein n=1 Tax=Brevibacillus nitrificans TaxID=651560 RepID=UPI0016061914|nr:Ig-like domain-containing protein [Brevibacillus nitrificans]
MNIILKGQGARLLASWRTFLLFAVICCLLVGGAKTAAAADTSRVAKVDAVTGNVQVKKAGGTKAYKAFKSMSLNQGDVITTGPKSSITMSMDQSAEVTVSENTVLSLSDLQAAIASNQTNLKVWSGSVFIKVKPFTNKQDKFTISTPTAIMGVRGTQLLVSIDPNTGSSSVFVASGTVATQAPGNSQIQNIYAGMLGSYYPSTNGVSTLPPESAVSFIQVEDLLQSLSPQIIEALIRNKALMDLEHDQFIAQLTQQLAGSSIPSTLQLSSDADLKRYQQNLENLLNALLQTALEKNIISKDDIADLIQAVNTEVNRKIDLDKPSELDWNSKQDQMRDEWLKKEEQRKKQAEEEKQRQKDALTRQAELLAKLQEQRDKLNNENEKAKEEALKKAQEQFNQNHPAAPGSSAGSSGGSGSGGSGSGGSGSGGSGGSDKDDPTITSIAPLSLETFLQQSYTLPATVEATMNKGSKREVPVTWNKKADTSLTGVYTFEGTVKDYEQKVKATLTVFARIGTPVPLLQQRILFENGVVMDFGSMSLPEKATVTLQNVSPDFSNEALSAAGPIIDFVFQGIEIHDPVTIAFPVNGKSAQQVGIFHRESETKWEYVPTTVEAGIATATVNHFSTYGVLKAPQVAAVTATPDEGLVDHGTSISLASETSGATIYIKKGNEWKAYPPSEQLTVPGDGDSIQAYASKLNMRDSDPVSFSYSTAQASVMDSSTISVSFTQPVDSASYQVRVSSPSTTLPIALVELHGDSGLTIALGVDTTEMLIQSYTVQFFKDSRYVAQSNSFTLGKVPPPLPVPSVEEIEIHPDESPGRFFWSALEGDPRYRIYVNNEEVPEPFISTDGATTYLELQGSFEPDIRYVIRVEALDEDGKVIAKGNYVFTTEPIELPDLNIKVTDKRSNRIGIKWTQHSFNGWYRIHLVGGNGEPRYYETGETVYTFSDLQPDTEYSISIEEVTGDDITGTGEKTVRTLADGEEGFVQPFDINYDPEQDDFYWDSILDAASYTVYVNGDRWPADIDDSESLTRMTLYDFFPSAENDILVEVYDDSDTMIAEGSIYYIPDEGPEEPGEEQPGGPGSEQPGEPGSEQPGEPGSEQPGEPGSEQPGEPGSEQPGEPGSEQPGEPGSEQPGDPGSEQSGGSGGEQSGETGGEGEVPPLPLV